MTMIDLNSLNLTAQADAGYVMPVLSPFDDMEIPGMTIRIRGDKSTVVHAYERKRLNELQKRERVLAGKQKDTSFSFEELEEMAVDAAVVRIMSWTGMSEGGQELAFTEENAAYLMKKYSWMRDQVREAAKEVDNFRSE